MLSKEYRLRKMKDFEILFKEGIFLGGKFLNAKLWKIDPGKYPKREYSREDLKIGFLVSKKVHKSAVKRNRVKRQMREVVRLLLKDQKIKSGFMLAFMAKPNIIGVEYQEIEKDILFLLKKARLII